MTWSVERVIIDTRTTLCHTIRGTLAWILAPVLDWLYPPDSESNDDGHPLRVRMP